MLQFFQFMSIRIFRTNNNIIFSCATRTTIFSESPLDSFYLLETDIWIAGRTMSCRVREYNRLGIMNMSIDFQLGTTGSAQTSLFNESFRTMTYCRKEFLSIKKQIF